MSGRHAKTPFDLLLRDLSGRPEGTRVVLVLDPDRLIEWSRAITDSQGRAWQVVLYRGDDVATRRAWQKAWESGSPLCFALARPEGDDEPLDASYLADLVSRAEGDILDLSLTGYFHALFPRVNPPENVLREYGREFVANGAGFMRSYPMLKERWGEPDSWSRGQFLAALLLSRYEDLSLPEVWCDEVEPAGFAAHVVWLLCQDQFQPEDLRLLRDVCWESSRIARGCPELSWVDVQQDAVDAFRKEVAAFLVLRRALCKCVPQHLDALLRAKLRFTTFDPEAAAPLADEIIRLLQTEDRWPAIQRMADSYLDPTKMSSVAALVEANSGTVHELITSGEVPAAFVRHFLRRMLMQRFQGSAAWPNWIAGLWDRTDGRLRDRTESESERACASLAYAVNGLAWVEMKLDSVIPNFSSAEALLDWYVSEQLHRLEYVAAESFAKLEGIDDDELHSAGYAFIMKAPDGLRYQVREFLNDLDRRLAVFVAADTQRFLNGPRSAIRIIPNLLRSGRRPAKQRVWILVLDGMRYDTWDQVVRPLLLDHFEIVDGQDKAYFSLLPSKTDIARRGLLAASLGKDWKNFYAKPTKDERVLAARAMGVSQQDFDQKVSFVTDAETTEAREKLRYSEAAARELNVLIYPISDDLGHYHNDTLASLNEKIRQQLVTQQGRRGIIDDLRRRVLPEDLVLVTSDHGFQELFPEEQIEISRLDARNAGGSDEDVVYRYLKLPTPPALPADACMRLDWEEQDHTGRKIRVPYMLAVGGNWFQRERGRPTRFSHGGVSLAEMTIPGTLLRPIRAKRARIEFIDLPHELSVEEDAVASFSFDLVNSGNVESAYAITVKTNTGKQLVNRQGVLPPAQRQQIKLRVTGEYSLDANRNVVPSKTTTAIILTLEHTDLGERMAAPDHGRQVITVNVAPKAAKLDTTALSAFDDV